MVEITVNLDRLTDQELLKIKKESDKILMKRAAKFMDDTKIGTVFRYTGLKAGYDLYAVLVDIHAYYEYDNWDDGCELIVFRPEDEHGASRFERRKETWRAFFEEQKEKIGEIDDEEFCKLKDEYNNKLISFLMSNIK